MYVDRGSQALGSYGLAGVLPISDMVGKPVVTTLYPSNVKQTLSVASVVAGHPNARCAEGLELVTVTLSNGLSTAACWRDPPTPTSKYNLYATVADYGTGPSITGFAISWYEASTAPTTSTTPTMTSTEFSTLVNQQIKLIRSWLYKADELVATLTSFRDKIATTGRVYTNETLIFSPTAQQIAVTTLNDLIARITADRAKVAAMESMDPNLLIKTTVPPPPSVNLPDLLGRIVAANPIGSTTATPVSVPTTPVLMEQPAGTTVKLVPTTTKPGGPVALTTTEPATAATVPAGRGISPLLLGGGALALLLVLGRRRS